MPPRIVLHFHPGWPFEGDTVLRAIVREGVYRSQWETGTSNGGLTAHIGGDRWRWESRLFDGQYDQAPPSGRPAYGAWHHTDDPYGAAPRFGSAYLRLRPEVTQRATYCWPDSVLEPEAMGGQEQLEELCRLSDEGIEDRSLWPEGAAGLPMDDPLNHYVEAQVHGGVVLRRDVEALVIDPTDREAHADTLAELGCPVEDHPGYSVTAAEIDPSYRGPVPVDLAMALGGTITPARLGEGMRVGEQDPQAVKWLWHCLARFGRCEPQRRGDA